MGLADIFRARDGDATLAGLETLAAGVAFLTVVLIVFGVWCWHQRQKRKRVWAAKIAEAVETALASRELAMENREDIELLRADEDKMALVVGGVLERILGELAPERPRLRVVR